MKIKKFYRVKVKEYQIAEYLIEVEEGLDSNGEDIFSNGEILDTIDDGNGEIVTECVVSFKEVKK